MEVTNLRRIFSFKKNGKDVQLEDPNPNMESAQVMKFYAGTYPELTNGVLEGPTVIKDQAIYTMKTQAGKLG
jgi:PRTRC genetic system protein C